MNLFFDTKIAENYKSPSQKIRVMTEMWAKENIFCPSCGNPISEYENNKPVADFFCRGCSEDFELKSKKDSMGNKIVDGAYKTMIERIQSVDNPNFFFLNYDKSSLSVQNFLIIPKHFFVPEIIEKRKPLSLTAKRAGWTGCNILLSGIPESGKIFYVKNGEKRDEKEVFSDWGKTLFLQKSKGDAKGWKLDIMKCIDSLQKKEFTLDEMYQFDQQLHEKYPENNFIKDKIRQQLQVLRDVGYIEFLRRGVYRVL